VRAAPQLAPLAEHQSDARLANRARRKPRRRGEQQQAKPTAPSDAFHLNRMLKTAPDWATIQDGMKFMCDQCSTAQSGDLGQALCCLLGLSCATGGSASDVSQSNSCELGNERLCMLAHLNAGPHCQFGVMQEFETLPPAGATKTLQSRLQSHLECKAHHTL
jgi:hypothetical protein